VELNHQGDEGHMDYDAFFESCFELCDLWTDGVEVDDYCSLIKKLADGSVRAEQRALEQQGRLSKVKVVEPSFDAVVAGDGDDVAVSKEEAAAEEAAEAEVEVEAQVRRVGVLGQKGWENLSEEDLSSMAAEEEGKMMSNMTEEHVAGIERKASGAWGGAKRGLGSKIHAAQQTQEMGCLKEKGWVGMTKEERARDMSGLGEKEPMVLTDEMSNEEREAPEARAKLVKKKAERNAKKLMKSKKGKRRRAGGRDGGGGSDDDDDEDDKDDDNDDDDNEDNDKEEEGEDLTEEDRAIQKLTRQGQLADLNFAEKEGWAADEAEEAAVAAAAEAEVEAVDVAKRRESRLSLRQESEMARLRRLDGAALGMKKRAMYLESLTEERGGHMDNTSAEEQGAYELAKERGLVMTKEERRLSLGMQALDDQQASRRQSLGEDPFSPKRRGRQGSVNLMVLEAAERRRRAKNGLSADAGEDGKSGGGVSPSFPAILIPQQQQLLRSRPMSRQDVFNKNKRLLAGQWGAVLRSSTIAAACTTSLPSLVPLPTMATTPEGERVPHVGYMVSQLQSGPMHAVRAGTGTAAAPAWRGGAHTWTSIGRRTTAI
jgi:hypothetical protein